MSTKCTYLFGQRSISNSRVKRAWAGVVEGWVTLRETKVFTGNKNGDPGMIGDGSSRICSKRFNSVPTYCGVVVIVSCFFGVFGIDFVGHTSRVIYGGHTVTILVKPCLGNYELISIYGGFFFRIVRDSIQTGINGFGRASFSDAKDPIRISYSYILVRFGRIWLLLEFSRWVWILCYRLSLDMGLCREKLRYSEVHKQKSRSFCESDSRSRKNCDISHIRLGKRDFDWFTGVIESRLFQNSLVIRNRDTDAHVFMNMGLLGDLMDWRIIFLQFRGLQIFLIDSILMETFRMRTISRVMYNGFPYYSQFRLSPVSSFFGIRYLLSHPRDVSEEHDLKSGGSNKGKETLKPRPTITVIRFHNRVGLTGGSLRRFVQGIWSNTWLPGSVFGEVSYCALIIISAVEQAEFLNCVQRLSPVSQMIRRKMALYSPSTKIMYNSWKNMVWKIIQLYYSNGKFQGKMYVLFWFYCGSLNGKIVGLLIFMVMTRLAGKNGRKISEGDPPEGSEVTNKPV
ncbi:unnamed protein product [Microthlaspi erraticum]|uniref:Transmembrane protein n=1 Tax=Microthlaspi erraticum TaxID=1685480 RepID=A0A6D2JJN7_9BRAS|nr:unnamed protein product [Microthlaspi erraticum]